MPTIIAVDGPAGVGKSTSARSLADELGLPFLDTGSIYRAIAWLANQNGIDYSDEIGCCDLVDHYDIEITGPGRISIADQDISDAIREPEASMGSSLIAVHPRLRRKLLVLQRTYALVGGCVLEGRDTGTVVFPDASIKFFLTADPAIRQARASSRNNGARTDIHIRDRIDSTRAAAPLVPADNAIVIDTSSMLLHEVVDKMITYYRDSISE
jgi:cytidylate kinase